jgi:hypothetical protein
MSKIQKINGRDVLIFPGDFPTLVSSKKEENGKLLANTAHCLPRGLVSNERYAKSTDEISQLKRAKREWRLSPKKATTIT